MKQAMDFSCAFQPIVDICKRQVFSYELLVRGCNNEPALDVFSKIPNDDLIEFDQKIREKGIILASSLHLKCHLDLNFLPKSIQYTGDFISRTIDFAKHHHIKKEQLIFELTEKEAILEPVQFSRIINKYRGTGIKVAIDDFGSGYSGLNMLVDFLPDIIKLDIKLIKNIHRFGPQQAIVEAITQVCTDLGIDIIAEGVESEDEFKWLKAHGIILFQGFFFAKPGFECLPKPFFPD